VARESSADLVPVNISDVALAAEPTTRISLGANLDARLTGQNLPIAPPAFPLSVEYFDVLGGAEKLNFEFLPSNTAVNTWNMKALVPGNAVPIGEYEIVFSQDTDPAIPSLAGYIDSVTPVAPAPGTWNAATGELTLALPDGLERQVMIGQPGMAGPLSQFKAQSEPSNITKNGSPVSDIIGIEISESGVMDAIFSSGFRKSIYKIPVGSVQNPNGLNALDGQVYTLSRESGSIYFYDAGAGPTGRLVSNALEESTTDIAEELTQLIKTQRAYSSNAKIIQTVDEMLQETTNLKR
jgi:flagellar hook protein FlgE